MYSGKFPCSLGIINYQKKKKFGSVLSMILFIQGNIDPVYFTQVKISPENYATFAQS